MEITLAPMKRMVVLVMAGMLSFAATADEENATNAQPGLFDSMAEDVKRSLDEKHAARQARRASGDESNPDEDAQPGLFDNMAEDVKRTLDEKHAARQARKASGDQSNPDEDTQPGLFDNMAEDVKRTLDEKHAARQE